MHETCCINSFEMNVYSKEHNDASFGKTYIYCSSKDESYFIVFGQKFEVVFGL